MALSVTGVRVAEPEDLPLLAAVEAEADRQFAPLLDTSGWGEPPTGEQRAEHGTLLVIGHPAAGFAHVLFTEGPDGPDAHLDQLCVRPRSQRRGLGARLLHAAYGVALDAGAARLTLTTFADVPWNAPWYARHGFEPVPEPLPAALEAVREAERRAGLDAGGRRLAMARAILDEPVPRAAVSVLPVREGPDGIEVFVQHRVGTMDFLPHALVFPGGRVDPGDAALGAALELPADVLAEHARAWAAVGTPDRAFGVGEPGARTTLATAVREVREETGADIDPARLIPWDNWETPIGGPRRFDVRFLLLPVRDDAEAAAFAHSTTEAAASHWEPVRRVLAGAEDGSLRLVSPTRVLAEELADLASVAAAAALRPPIVRVRHDTCPTPALRGRLPNRLPNRGPTATETDPATDTGGS